MARLDRNLNKVNTLLDIFLEIVEHDEPAMRFDRQGTLVADYTKPFSIEWHRPDGITEYLTPRLDASEVRMFLEGIRFVGARATVHFPEAADE